MGRRSVRVPTILQMEAVECGAASLAMILAYFGRHVPLEEVRTEAGVSRDGAKAINIVKAARRYGLVAKAYKKELAELAALAPPYVLFWNFNHFVVVEGLENGKAHLNDPALGRRTASADELDRSFTGVVLTFEPGPDFVKGGSPTHLATGLRARLRGSEIGLALVVLITLTLVVPGIVLPAFTKIFVDDYLVGRMQDWLRPMLLALAITAIIRTALTYLQQRYLLRLQVKLGLTTSSKFVWHLLRLPVEFFTQRFAGDLRTRVQANDRVAQLLSGDLSTNIVNMATVVFYALVMASYDVVLTIVCIALSLVNLLALRLIWRRREDANRVVLQEQGKQMAASMNGLLMMETLKATGSEPDFFARWAGYQAKLVSKQQELGVYTQALNSLPVLLGGLTTAALLGLGSLHVMDGIMTIGELMAFQTLMASFATPIKGFVDLGARLQEVTGDLARLDDVLHYVPDPRCPEGAPPEPPASVPPKLGGRLELRGVTFGYSKLEAPLIRDFDLVLDPGTRVAIVGLTGSGKSTIVKLASGLYQPWSGEVLYDGQPLAEVDRRVLASSLAVVDQEIFLFEGTVRDNLTLWDDSLDEDAIVRAAKDACIHDVVTARPHGYHAAVAEEGVNFSGGERQRLEIARGLAVDPTIMLLDEATAALDPMTEQAIDDHVRRRGCTCLIVAHRLSTIRDCEEIVVLQDGVVVQRGTHDRLKDEEGEYARLIRAQ